ncbi:MAG TPA: aminotransferase class IV [Chiayiivirga sp.]|nr:aminotransferase class IV [Chiayiivirga sp.]
MSDTRAFVDGEPASTAALIRFARNAYHHFTTMQVRAGAVRGLDLHLARLSQATRALFDVELDLFQLRRHLRVALAGQADAALRISIGARNYSARAMPVPAQIESLILVDSPSLPRSDAMRLMSVQHMRHHAQFKHSGLFDVFALRRQALACGFDDAVLLDDRHCINEGPTFNLGFFQDDALIWPEADKLAGTSERLLQQAWAQVGGKHVVRPITLADLQHVSGGFACHSGGIWPLSAIDSQVLPVQRDALARLCQIWDGIAAEPI